MVFQGIFNEKEIIGCQLVKQTQVGHLKHEHPTNLCKDNINISTLL
jgi:hypothetical protein